LFKNLVSTTDVVSVDTDIKRR